MHDINALFKRSPAIPIFSKNFYTLLENGELIAMYGMAFI